ncbi:MAG: Protein-tyrosine sulfotransferase [Caulobacteraceae bacterium]|nr:Protein-tyrosine sulfotransferase [Caulobacteraceae bacterium]
MTVVDPDYAAVADAVRRQDRPLAINLAARALKRGHNHPLILVLAAEGLEERGKAAQALDLLRAATRAAPKNRVAWMRLAPLLARQRKFEEAAAAFDAVLAIDPDSFGALMGAGEMRLQLRDPTAAEHHYRRAAEVAPGSAAPLAVLAVMAAQKRNVEEARELAARAAAITPGILGAEMAVARAELLEGRPALAEARLTPLLGRTELDDENRAGVLDVRAEAFDAQGRTDEAFGDYEARNAILLRLNTTQFGGESAQRLPQITRRLTTFVAMEAEDAWRASPGEDSRGLRSVRRHVFLLGFPRSGTTLLEKVLGGHPQAVTLEEVNHLTAATLDLRGEAGWRRLARLTQAEADVCRETYWRLVRGSLGDDLSDKILVDKLPLHTLDLPMIARLFPDARILLALRDPRDVVLSCYRRRFQVNLAMFEFLTLRGAADFYDAAMGLANIARSRLPLILREVRHETVIADFDREVGEILDFIGAEWDPAVRDFADRVGGHMRTPSYAQLARGLNADGVGQWRRYERQMAPILDVLDPWVAQFGYPPTPPDA